MNFMAAVALQLEGQGLTRHQSNTVVRAIMDDPKIVPDMNDRWSHSVEGYPKEVLVSVLKIIRPFVFEWLKKDAPQAWYLASFSPELDGLDHQARLDFIQKFMQEQQQAIPDDEDPE